MSLIRRNYAQKGLAEEEKNQSPAYLYELMKGYQTFILS